MQHQLPMRHAQAVMYDHVSQASQITNRNPHNTHDRAADVVLVSFLAIACFEVDECFQDGRECSHMGMPR